MDSPADPLNGLVAGESYGALALEVSFLDPRTWADDVVPDGDVDRALETWRDSWDLVPDHAAEVRETVYPILVDAFAPQMSTEDLEYELDLLDEALRRASAVADVAWPSHVVAGLTLTRTSRKQARAAFAVGDQRLALLHLMRGGDALRTVGPWNAVPVRLWRPRTGLWRSGGRTMRAEFSWVTSDRLSRTHVSPGCRTTRCSSFPLRRTS
jgi:hypothetical protein